MARGYKIAAPDVVMIEDDVDEEQEVDLLKEPESSVESEDEIKDAPPAAADSGTKISATKLKRPTRRAQAAQEKRTRQQSGRRKRSSSDIKDEDDGPQAETTKVSRRRTNGDVCENEIDDSGPMFPDFDVAMSSQPRPSQRNPVDNLFANRPRERRPGYGRSSQPTRSQDQSGFIKPAVPEDSPEQPKSAFRRPQAVPDTDTTTTSKPKVFQHPSHDRSGSFSPLSDAHSSSSSDRSLTPPPTDIEIEQSQEHLAFISSSGPDSSGPLARCPTCKEVVDLAFLEEFSTSKRLGWKEKLEFCKAHKRRTAEDTYHKQPYPHIDWDNFDKRLASFKSRVGAILDGKRGSYYHNELEERLASSNTRNALRNQIETDRETVTTGYYGSKGAQMMLQWLVTQFMTRVRKRATADKTVRATGPTGYMQAVLVPELAVMLVMEDIGVDDEQARVVLKESAELGELLNAEKEDKIEREHSQAADEPTQRRESGGAQEIVDLC